jgi:hypothetical protein
MEQVHGRSILKRVLFLSGKSVGKALSPTLTAAVGGSVFGGAVLFKKFWADLFVSSTKLLKPKLRRWFDGPI